MYLLNTILPNTDSDDILDAVCVLVVWLKQREESWSEFNLSIALFHSQVFTTWSTIPLTYCFSFVFSNSLAAYGLLMIFFFFVALVS